MGAKGLIASVDSAWKKFALICHIDETRPHQRLSAKSSNSSRGSDNGYSLGEGAVVQVPAKTEGGRLECDRIIMADGTAIDLFDENDDQGAREKAHKRSRERQDEVRIDRSENLQ